MAKFSQTSVVSHETLTHAPLGKTSPYISLYTPSLLFPIPRQPKREEIAVPTPLPFSGYDIWNAFELSWLSPKGKPQVAMVEFIIPCTSQNIADIIKFCTKLVICFSYSTRIFHRLIHQLPFKRS